MSFRRLLVCAALALPGALAAQRNYDSVQVRTLKVANGVYMLMGAGGNRSPAPTVWPTVAAGSKTRSAPASTILHSIRHSKALALTE